ncbi:MAG: BREX-2 system adenine-specific DNA-methyltransferase PglX [Acidocella sp.]|nr:BREX-2 system adenine-specific DNA-methyltransferase PglX [Acidocella sp.]
MPAGATEDDHLGLLGVLNSSVACFWVKQIAHNKGDSTDQHGARTTGDPAFNTYEFSATQLEAFPLPNGRPLALARQIDSLAQELASHRPDAITRRYIPSASILAEQHEKFISTLGQMIALQEELDWECYRLYGLLEDSPRCQHPPEIQLGQRAFEIILARAIASGEEQSAWFTRHNSTPMTAIPTDWPPEYRAIVQQRLDIIESNASIALIERPEFKRRWNTEAWDQQQEQALRGWLLDRLEALFDLDGRMNERQQITAHADLHQPALTSLARIADLARADKDFMQVAEVFTGRMDFDVGTLVGELVAAESVPALPVLRYKPAAMDKRRAWERTWELQRLEDAVESLFEVDWLKSIAAGQAEEALRPRVMALQIDEQAKPVVLHEAAGAAGYVADAVRQQLNLASEIILKPVHDAAKRAKRAAVGDIPVPPKYTSADFLSGAMWRLRGKLDVPKERWVSFPNCEGEDGTLVVAWAGYDHLQMARAIAERYELAKENEGRKLVPLLAAIGQLVPWLKQWHNELDPKYATRMGDYFEGYVAEEARAMGKSVQDVMAWSPP